jgi:hypothetical protein
MPSVLGIDVSSHAIDLVKLDETTNAATWRRIQLEGATAFDRLRSLRMPWRTFYDDVYLIAIETPKTRFMPSAAAIFPVYGAVIAFIPSDLEVWPIHPTEWRKGIGLPGNASKAECGDRVHQLHRPSHVWAQDALDAYAVAYTARTINQRGIEAA